MGKRSNLYKITILSIIIIGAILRLRGLNFQSLWMDEIHVLAYSSRSTWQAAFGPGGICCTYEGAFYHSLYSIIGNSDFSARMVSAFAGILLILITAEIGREIHSESTGMVSSAFIAVSYSGIYFSQEARHYIITTMILWGIFLLLIRGPNRLPKWAPNICLGALCFPLLFSYNAEIILFLGLFSLALTFSLPDKSKSSEEDQRNWKNAFQGKTGLVLMYLFVSVSVAISRIPNMISDIRRDVQPLAPTLPSEPHIDLIQGFLTCDEYCRLGPPDSQLVNLFWFLICLSPILWGYSILSGSERSRPFKHPEMFLYATSFGYLVVVWYFTKNFDTLYLYRYNLVALPGWVLIASLCLSRLASVIRENVTNSNENMDIRNLLAVLISLAIVSNGAHNMAYEYSYYTTETKTDFRGMASSFATIESEYDTFSVATPNSIFINNYLSRNGVGEGDFVDVGWGTCYVEESVRNNILNNKHEMVTYLATFDLNTCKDNSFISFLEEEYSLVKYEKFHNGEIFLYSLGVESHD